MADAFRRFTGLRLYSPVIGDSGFQFTTAEFTIPPEQ